MKTLASQIMFISFLFSNFELTSQVGNDSISTDRKSLQLAPKITGLIQCHYLNEFDTNGDRQRDPDGFRILRLRLNIEGDINKYISYQVMIDPRAPEQGGVLRDAYLVFHILKNQNIRVGQQKTQFGWENRQSMKELYTINRAEMSDAVARGENLRDIGIGLIGFVKIKKNWRFENAITFTNGTRSNVAGPYDFNTKKAIWGRLGLRYKKENLTLKVGGSFGFGGIRFLNDNILDPNDDLYLTINRIGSDIQIEHEKFSFAAEFAKGTNKNKHILIDEPIGYQTMLALKSKFKMGPLIRYDQFEDEWKVLTYGIYYGEPKEKFRILLNYMNRKNITDIPNGHDDRLYIQFQLAF